MCLILTWASSAVCDLFIFEVGLTDSTVTFNLLYNLGQPQTYDPPASTSPLLGLQACATPPGSSSSPDSSITYFFTLALRKGFAQAVPLGSQTAMTWSHQADTSKPWKLGLIALKGP